MPDIVIAAAIMGASSMAASAMAKPKAPPPPEPPAMAPGAAERSAEGRRKRLYGGGRQSTVVGSPLGLPGPARTATSTLLGGGQSSGGGYA